MNRPNGVNTTYGYDSVSRLSNLLHKAGTTTLDGAGYTYDNAGNRTSKTNFLNNTAENYTYDPLYQLTQVAQGTTTTESYSYDPVGNRLSSLGMSPYAYNSSNQLTSTPAATFTYDGNGNTLTKADSSGTTTYRWDFENRLTSVVLPGSGGTVTFKYDPSGRRIQKSSALGTTNYLYDGINIVEETDASGNEGVRYAQGVGLDEPLAETRSGTTSYYEQDGLGSVTSLSGTTGTLANTYTYDGFGNLTASTGSLGNPFQYTGRDYDPEIGLRYYRARYYDPAVGRFLSEDQTGFGAGVNFYAYANDSPTNLVDPFGFQSQGSAAPSTLPNAPGGRPFVVPGSSPGPKGPGPVLGPGFLITLDAWLLDHDIGEFRKLCGAYGWAWCAPDPLAWWKDLTGSLNFFPSKNPGRCKAQGGCQPCDPPVGSLSYRTTDDRGHFPFLGPHWTLYEMHQMPAPKCDCFWVKLGVGQEPAQPPAQAKPFNPGASRGGGPL